MPSPSADNTLQKILAETAASPALLIVAGDEIRKRRTCRLLLDKFPGASTQRLDAKEMSQDKLDYLANELNSLSLFSANRFIIIENIEKLSAAIAKKFIPLLKQGSAGASLILLANKSAECHGLFEYFRSANRLVIFEDLTTAQLRTWVKTELSHLGIHKYSSSLIDSILAVGQDSLDSLAVIMEQLSLYADGDQVSDEEFYRLFIETPDPKDYQLVEAIERKDLVKAEVTLDELLTAGKSPFLILATLFRTYANYLRMCDLLKAGLSHEQIRQKFNMKPWLFDKQLTAARAYSLDKLKSKLDRILAADGKLKNRSIGADAVCSELVGSLAA